MTLDPRDQTIVDAFEILSEIEVIVAATRESLHAGRFIEAAAIFEMVSAQTEADTFADLAADDRNKILQSRLIATTIPDDVILLLRDAVEHIAITGNDQDPKATALAERIERTLGPDTDRFKTPDPDDPDDTPHARRGAAPGKGASVAEEMRLAYEALQVAQARWEESVRAIEAAGWRHVGVNRWEPPGE